MPRLLSLRAAAEVLRAGHVRARLRAMRDGQAAIRLLLTAAALRCGVLDTLADGSASTAQLARRAGATDEALFDAFLRVVAAGSLIEPGEKGTWRLTRAGRAVLDDDLVRAAYEGFGGFHTDLYRDIGALLAGGPPRRDVLEHGGVIARMSAGFEPFVQALLTATITERRPRRVLDVGCGAGLQLATMLEAAGDEACAVGVEMDAEAAALAERTLARRGLAARSTVLTADIRAALAGDGPTALAEPFDLVLLANAIYYEPPAERVPYLRALGGVLAPGGTLIVITTVATADLFSRHLDLLLRAQEGRMELPDVTTLVEQLRAAGLHPEEPRRIAPGSPLFAVLATRPA